MPLADFIKLPDTVAFVVRYNGATEEYISRRQDVYLGKQLSGNYAVVYTSSERLGAVLYDIGAVSVNVIPSILAPLASGDIDSAGITAVRRQPYLSLRGQGALLGFVDSGIDYTNGAFKYEDNTTRIRYIWDQTESGASPEGYGFGSEYSSAAINAALSSDAPYTVVPHRDTVGHGTFLASVAGSREQGEYMGAAPDAEFIIVKLKSASPYYRRLYLIPEDSEPAYESGDLMQGIEYIVQKAGELERPVAICVSLGSNMGGHDGFGVLEEYLARISFMPGVAVCAAAGNESTARHHAQGRVAQTNDSVDIQVRTAETSRSFAIEIWNNSSDRLAVSVQSPAGEILGRVPARSGTSYSAKLILEPSSIVVEYYFPIEGSGSQLSVVSIIDPSPGIWTISVYGEIILDGTFHAWLPITGLVSPDVEFLTPSPYYTMASLATATGVITCGAYASINNSLYSLSSWGHTRLPMMAPDLTAPGVDVGGIFPSGYGKMSGTSVAAAITTGACALMLEWGVADKNDTTLNTYLVRANLIRGCDRDNDTEYPNVQWGYGRLNLYNSFYLLRNI
jgi:hypothetical protein